MPERTAAYESLMALTGLDPAVIRAVDVGTLGGMRLATVRFGETKRIRDYGTVVYHEDSGGTPVIDLPAELERLGTRFVPVVKPILAAAPNDADEYWRRTAVISKKIAAFDGRFQLAGGRENGWLPIIERVVDAICTVLDQRGIATVAFERSYGMLCADFRVAYGSPDEREFLGHLREWSEAVALERCMVSGEPGWYGPLEPRDPWKYVLSDRIRALTNPLARELVYPRPPEPRL